MEKKFDNKDQEKITALTKYYNEHILYEVGMLRYCYQKLTTEDQILWNAMFAAFGVSARNIYYFLTNGDGANKKIAEYAIYRNRTNSPSKENVKDVWTKVNDQLFHMGKRTYSASEKVTIGDLKKLYDWLEKELNNIENSFKDDFRSSLNPLSHADFNPSNIEISTSNSMISSNHSTINIEPSRPSSSSQPISTSMTSSSYSPTSEIFINIATDDDA